MNIPVKNWRCTVVDVRILSRWRSIQSSTKGKRKTGKLSVGHGNSATTCVPVLFLLPFALKTTTTTTNNKPQWGGRMLRPETGAAS